MKYSLRNSSQHQEERHLLEHVGSSETIRKSPPIDFKKFEKIYQTQFDFTQLQHCLPLHKKKWSPEFLSWFLGFSEGDGSFIIDPKNKRLFFTITQKDPALLHRLRTELGFGTVCNDTQCPDTKRFTVTCREHVLILIHLFNGNLLLKKTTQRFLKWVEAYNTFTGESIPLLSRWPREPFHVSPSRLSNEKNQWDGSRYRMPLAMSTHLRQESVVWTTAWLTGFLEADGGFSACIRSAHKIEIRFYLDQTNEIEILMHVRHLLDDKGSLVIRKQSDSSVHYRFSVTVVEKLDLLTQYLGRYPLKSKKKIAWARWTKLVNILHVIRQEKRDGLYEWTPKRHQRIVRLVGELEKSNCGRTKRNKRESREK